MPRERNSLAEIMVTTGTKLLNNKSAHPGSARSCHRETAKESQTAASAGKTAGINRRTVWQTRIAPEFMRVAKRRPFG